MPGWLRNVLAGIVLVGLVLGTWPQGAYVQAAQATPHHTAETSVEPPPESTTEDTATVQTVQPEPGIPNDRWDAALTLELNQPYTQALASKTSPNWYRFTLPRAGVWQFIFESSVTQQTDGWFVELFRATADGPASEPDYADWFCPADNARLTVPRLHEASGDYYVHIGGENLANYSIWVVFTPDDDGSDSSGSGSSSTSSSGSVSGGGSSSGSDDEPDPTGKDSWEAEPNNDVAAANTLVAGQLLRGTLFGHDDLDWFTFTLDKPGLLALHLESTALVSGGTWQAWLYEAGGLFPAEAPVRKLVLDATLAGVDENIGLPAGQYYLRLFGDGMPGLEYALRYAHTPDAGWEQEPNNTHTQANSLPLGTTGYGNSSTADDYDWYRFTIAAHGALQFSLAAPGVVAALEGSGWVAEVYAEAEGLPEEKELAGRTTRAGEGADGEWLALAPGDYYLRIRPGDDAIVGQTYRLKLGLRAFAPVTEIRLAQARAYIVKGKSMTVGAVADTEDGAEAPLAWASSDEAVATVSAGRITAVKAGVATITAKAENGVYATVRVQVVGKIKLTQAVAIVGAPKKPATGKAYQLSARITPAAATGAAVRWKSSKSSVVRVDAAGGLVAKKPGKATLTLSAGGKKAHCEVQVVAPVRRVRLPQKTLALVAGKTASLTAVATTTNGSKAKLVWSSSNPDVAAVSQKGRVRAVAPGSAKITVKAENGKKAVLAVQVRTQAITLKKVGVKGLPTVMAVGDSADVTARLNPATATGVVVKWQSSNRAVLAVDAAGTVTALAPGRATITLRAGKKKAVLEVEVRG